MKSRPDKQERARPSHHAVVQPKKAALLKRLNRIEGQARGIAKMVEEDRYCVDVLTQISAIQSALDALAIQLLENHTNGCVRAAIKSGNGEAAVDELMAVVKRFSR
ncbi:MAG: metal-sensitive transcriptional regulator [Gammaproteobacteria bacterium]|nr:metal-sensitive transcriptional regulator [Gammaproteobacteria bacterium]